MSRQVLAPMAGTMWKVLVKTGDTVSVGDTVAILESMKMEIPIESEHAGIVTTVDTPEGKVVDEGAPVVTLV